jgi:hypothetical protein
MDNLSYQYLDHNFSPDKAHDYTLLLQGNRSGFSFAVISKKKLLVLSNPLGWDVLREPASENNLLLQNYGKRIIGLPFGAFTFIPVSVFDPGKVADFARFLDVKAAEKVFSQPLDAENQVIFKISAGMLGAKEGTFSVKDVVFAPKGWIRAIAGGEPANQNLYLNITGETVEILNFKNGRLRFYNSFEFTNEDELAYFVTIAANELQLPFDTVNLVMSGETHLDDQNCDRLKYFFGSIELNALKVLTLPKQSVPHSILSLTALSLCGSSGVN